MAAPLTLSVGATLVTTTLKLRSATLWPSRDLNGERMTGIAVEGDETEVPGGSTERASAGEAETERVAVNAVATSGNDSD